MTQYLGNDAPEREAWKAESGRGEKAESRKQKAEMGRS
jgi:hypothetical protein